MLHLLDRHAIGQILRTKDIDAWGVAARSTPGCRARRSSPTAISMLMRLDPLVVRGLTHGPTHDYHQEYQRVNLALDDATGTLADVLAVHGHTAERVQATCDGANGSATFPHKTAATSAGLGWIRQDGPVRLAAVRPRGAPRHRVHRPRTAGR